MQNTNTRRGFTQTKSSRHAELVSASSRCQNKSHSRRFLSGIPTLFTARFVIPQGRCAGYSGRVGFTLIELLVVVLIIGILAAIAVPQYNKAVNKSRMAEAKVLMKALSDAQDIYALSHAYCGTDNANNLDISFGEVSEDGKHILTNNWDIYINDCLSEEGRPGNCCQYELYERRTGDCIALYNGNAMDGEPRNVLFGDPSLGAKYGGYKPEGKNYWVF